MRKPLVALAALMAAGSLAACVSGKTPHEVTMAGQQVTEPVSAAKVAQLVTVKDMPDGSVVYRAPVIGSWDQINQDTAFGVPLGKFESGATGYLAGIRKPDGTVIHRIVYANTYVQGSGRYKEARLGNGKVLPVKHLADHDLGDWTVETVGIDIPDADLRSPGGSAVTLVLDNGNTYDLSIPESYEQGYLSVVDKGAE